MSCDFYAKNSKIWHFLAIGSRSGLLRGLFLLCTCDFGNIFWFYSEKPGVFFGSGADPLFSEKQVFWKYWKFLGISSLFPLGFSNNLHFGFFLGLAHYDEILMQKILATYQPWPSLFPRGRSLTAKIEEFNRESHKKIIFLEARKFGHFFSSCFLFSAKTCHNSIRHFSALTWPPYFPKNRFLGKAENSLGFLHYFLWTFPKIFILDFFLGLAHYDEILMQKILAT